jgi:hypothetical protein
MESARDGYLTQTTGRREIRPFIRDEDAERSRHRQLDPAQRFDCTRQIELPELLLAQYRTANSRRSASPSPLLIIAHYF